MSEQVFSHKPVLLDECIEALAIRPEGVYLDGTLGRAGHSREIVRRLTTGRLICVDRDQAALDAAEERLAPWRERVTLVHSNFCALDAILDGLGLDGSHRLVVVLMQLVNLMQDGKPVRMSKRSGKAIARWTCAWTRPNP